MRQMQFELILHCRFCKLLKVTCKFRRRTCLKVILWTAPSEKVPSPMRKNAYRLSCACAKYHPGLNSRFIHSAVSNDSVSGQWMPWSDYVDAKADLGLPCPLMPEDTFSHMTHTIMLVIFGSGSRSVWSAWKLLSRGCPICNLVTNGGGAVSE